MDNSGRQVFIHLISMRFLRELKSGHAGPVAIVLIGSLERLARRFPDPVGGPLGDLPANQLNRHRFAGAVSKNFRGQRRQRIFADAESCQQHVK